MFFLTGTSGWKEAAGWMLLASSWLATYTAFAMLLEGAAGRVLLPLGHVTKRANATARERNTPGVREHFPLEFEFGEPGVRHGQ